MLWVPDVGGSGCCGCLTDVGGLGCCGCLTSEGWDVAGLLRSDARVLGRPEASPSGCSNVPQPRLLDVAMSRDPALWVS